MCDTVRHDVVLGMDFIFEFDVDLRGGRHMWRAREEPWHPSKLPEAEDRPLLFAECAGISLCEPGEVERLNELINRLLPEDNPAPGLTNRSEHHIRVMTNTPVRHHLRRMSPAMEAVAQAEVKKLYEAGFIERSASDWCSAPVIVRKQDGSNRFCIDYRDLNKVTLQDQYPIPNMDGILDKLRKAKYLSKVDLKNAYHQIPMEEHSKPYTAFAVPGSGLWQYTRMPFGLCNAPRTFQRLIDSLFGPVDQPHIFGYLDDIIVATDSFDEHLRWLEVVLTRLREAGLAVNRKKCEFCCQRLSYLGFLLDSKGLRPDPERVAPVLECKPPRTLKELRSFLGCISWYSRFIQMESSAKIPLLKLTKKDVPWKWGPEQQEAFDNLKQSLVTALVLARPDFTKPFKVQSDASAYAIGAVLTQEHEDGEHPIVYISRVLNKAEKNYSTTERECLAVVWAIKKFRPYLEGYTFTVVTDHSALKSLQTAREPTGRLARWALELQNWTFTIEHRKGTHMKMPDFLSRMPTQDDEVAAFENVNDPWYLDRLADVAKFPRKYREWHIDDGLLYRHRKDELLDPIEDGVEGWRLIVPAEHRPRVLQEAHDEPSAGHLGQGKTYDRVARQYYWPGVWHDVQNYVSSCDVCQRYKLPQTGPQGLLGRRIVGRRRGRHDGTTTLKNWLQISLGVPRFIHTLRGIKATTAGER
uniref:RNA-directed DNA polymerase n=1 Tax=Trichogramma kaykai TaxID=54128 RepID=A0ABD2WZD5_9HYME